MDPFEYVVVITSLITGLGIAQILNGMADTISHLKSTKLSAPLSMMAFSTLLNLIQEWFYTYQYAASVESWTLLLVLGVLIYPTLLFVLARMLVPTGLRSLESDLQVYYKDQWRELFIVSALVIFASIFHDLFISKISIVSQLPKIIVIVAHLVFIIFKITNKTAHFVFQLLALLGMIAFIAFTDTALVDYMVK